MRILVAEPVSEAGLALLRSVHQVDVRPSLPREAFLAALPDYDALIVRSQVKVDAAAIAVASRLIVVGRAGVGVDNIDLEAATRAGILVVNAPTGNTVAAAEHTVALLLAVARRVAQGDASIRRGEWIRGQLEGMELRGKSIGIVGLGKVGMSVASRARALEMEVLGHDPFVSAEVAANHGISLLPFDELLARSDVLTLHVPATRTTRGMIGTRQLETMRPGALLVNVSRGAIVDEQALADALRSGRLGGAGIDVFSAEPPHGSPLLDAPNTVLTPHLGASTAEAQVRVAVEVAEQVLEVLDGRPARYAANAPLVTPETAQALAPYLPLAETLGQFYAQFARGPMSELTLEVAGDLATHDTTPLAAAVLRGLLSVSTDERVNQVNAAAIAKARGLSLVEQRSRDAGTYASLLTLKGATTVAGTVANGESRLVRLADYWIDMAPSTWMLVTRHRDRPGTMGRVGLMLGEADVNISAMHLARRRPREDALMVLALDDPVPDAVTAAIRGLDAVLDLWIIRLGPAA
jgi:D-3-phosphoglycerate dehydrogenase